MSETNRLKDPGVYIIEVGYKSDPRTPDSYIFEINPRPDKRTTIQVKVTEISITQPIVNIIANPSSDCVACTRLCRFQPSKEEVTYLDDVIDKESEHFGKLFYGLETRLYAGNSDNLSGFQRKEFTENFIREGKYSFHNLNAPTPGVIRGQTIMNPGWKFDKLPPHPDGSGVLSVDIPNIFLATEPIQLNEDTIVEIKNSYSKQIPLPSGPWRFSLHNISTFLGHYLVDQFSELPSSVKEEYSYRLGGLNVGTSIHEGFSLRYWQYSVPEEEDMTYESGVQESKFKIQIELDIS